MNSINAPALERTTNILRDLHGEEDEFLFDGPSSNPTGNLEDATYGKIREALIEGRLKPGQSFTLRGLAQVFGTSAMPVRDALKRLVAERALQMLPNRSVMLPLMSRERFQEILQVRLNLEPAITLKAAWLITPAVIDEMAGDHQEMCEAFASGAKDKYLACNRRFHFRLYKQANSMVMLPFVESLWMQVGPYLNQVFDPGNTGLDIADHHHTDVLRALRRRDAGAAAKAIAADLSCAGDAILVGNLFSDEHHE